jgi:glycosyltransferase involved in cell wall biosynthesis
VSPDPVVIMVTPRLDAPGGIASVVAMYRRSKLGERFDVRYVETVGCGSIGRRVLESVTGVLRARRAVKAAGPSAIVHLHTSYGGSFARKANIARAAHRVGSRVVFHIHGSQFHTFATGSARRRRQVRTALEAADAVLVLSETWRGRIAGIAPEARIEVLENPVEIPEGETLSAVRDGVLFLGRLGERKGVPTLLGAIARLQGSGVRSRFTLAGDGQVAETAAAVSRLPFPEDVSVPGWVGAATVRTELLPEHGIFCLPSRDEGQPIALLEAMAFGMACVVTPAGGIPDTVTDGVDAVTVPIGDAGELAATLERLIVDSAARLALGAGARATAERRFSIDAAVERLWDIYARLADGGAVAR